MKILVTGANGFIGKHLVNRLLDLGHTIYTLDNKNDKSKQMAETPVKKLSLHNIFCNITNKGDLVSKVKNLKIDTIVHLAAFSNSNRDPSLMQKAFNINVQGTLNLLDALEDSRYGIFINISTAELYHGNKIPFKEDMQINPVSPYSLSKAASEHMLSAYSRAKNKNILTLRLALVYGPMQEGNRFLSQVINAIKQQKKLDITKCEQSRDYIYIDDVIDAIIAIINYKNKNTLNSEIINIGTGKHIKLNHCIKIIEELLGKKLKIGKILPYRDNEVFEYCLDCSKAQKLLNWHAKTNFNEGIKLTLEQNVKPVTNEN